MSGVTVLYEDNHVMAVFKPAGAALQGDTTGRPPFLDEVKAFLKARDSKPGNVFLGLVHRLDRPVSGVVVFGKTSKGASRLSEAFRSRRVEKHYWALVEAVPKPAEARLEQWVRREGTRTQVCGEGSAEAQRAVLSYRTLESRGAGALLEVRLETGRKHQIRAQLEALGCPIQGDRSYGAQRPWKPDAIALQAVSLKFPHPTQDTSVLVEVPEGLRLGWAP